MREEIPESITGLSRVHVRKLVEATDASEAAASARMVTRHVDTIGEAAVPYFARQLAHPVAFVRGYMILVLRAFGPKAQLAVPALLATIGNDALFDANAQGEAAEAVVAIDGGTGMCLGLIRPRIIEVPLGPGVIYLFEILELLGTVAAPLIPDLQLIGPQPDEKLETQIFRAMSTITGRMTKPALAIGLDGDDPAKLEALRRIRRLGPAAAIVAEEVCAQLQSENDEVATAAVEALVAFGAASEVKEVAQALVAALRFHKGRKSEAIFRLIGRAITSIANAAAKALAAKAEAEKLKKPAGS